MFCSQKLQIQRATEYSGLEGTHKHPQVQLLLQSETAQTQIIHCFKNAHLFIYRVMKDFTEC